MDSTCRFRMADLHMDNKDHSSTKVLDEDALEEVEEVEVVVQEVQDDVVASA